MDETYVPPDYCSTGWSLYNNIADMWANFDKAFPEQGILGVPFPETLPPEQAAARQAVEQAVNEAYERVYKHLDTCPRCYEEECRVKKHFGQEATIN
jgi:hypothetical protein